MALKQRTVSLTATQDKYFQQRANKTTDGDFGAALREFLVENNIE